MPGYKIPEGNVQFRRKIIKAGFADKAVAEELWIMCSRDLLFFINTFVMTYDPDLADVTTVPFVTYPFQDVALDELNKSVIEKYDLLTEKSRRMGLTWLILAIYLWHWCFHPYLTFRILSIKEDLVDKTDDPDCLFWKLLFMIKQLPSFLRPAYTYLHLGIYNCDNESTIVGLTTTSDSARSGRCTSMFPDEFAIVGDGDGLEAATQAVTKNRIFNSTHKGTGTTFYRLSKKPTVKKLTLHWSLHEIYQIGMYYSDSEGKLVIVKEFEGEVTVSRIKYQFPGEYPFRLDGKLRSPWYDNECDRASHPMQIAQELDIDPWASDSMFFDEPEIRLIETETCREPSFVGYLEFDPDTLEGQLVEQEGGSLKLWIPLGADGLPPRSLNCAIGIDISNGTGASNSTASVGDLDTHEKIAEYCNCWTPPESYAKEMLALANFFNGAYLIWDGSGPGDIFGAEVVKTGYRKFYYQRQEERLFKKETDKPGFFINAKTKRPLMGAYRDALKQRTFIQRSQLANEECMSYVYTVRNTVEHSSEYNNIDPSGAKSSHGDRVIADALLNKSYDIITSSGKPADKEIVNCFAARSNKRRRKRRNDRKDYW